MLHVALFALSLPFAALPISFKLLRPMEARGALSVHSYGK